MGLMGFLDKLFSRKKPSKDVAKERLQLVLSHDRMEIPPGVLDALKDDLIQVISKYMEIDESGIDVRINDKDSSEGRSLVANIPVASMKREKTRQ